MVNDPSDITVLRLIAIIVAVLSLVVVLEASLGHVRSGFPLRAQYAPLVVGAVLAIVSAATALAPTAGWVNDATRAAGSAAIVAGLVGVGYHHWFGIVEKAGGYGWLLHYLMYGAPQLAPLALAMVGTLALMAAHALSGNGILFGVETWRMVLAVVAVSLLGAIAQVGILHYRGAFNTPFMYVPLIIPPLAAAATAWMAAAPGTAAEAGARGSLWLTMLTGFLGLGMHVRGLDRQMGGPHIFLFNLLQGPPPLAPAVFAGLAAIGLASLELAR